MCTSLWTSHAYSRSTSWVLLMSWQPWHHRSARSFIEEQGAKDTFTCFVKRTIAMHLFWHYLAFVSSCLHTNLYTNYLSPRMDMQFYFILFYPSDKKVTLCNSQFHPTHPFNHLKLRHFDSSLANMQVTWKISMCTNLKILHWPVSLAILMLYQWSWLSNHCHPYPM